MSNYSDLKEKAIDAYSEKVRKKHEERQQKVNEFCQECINKLQSVFGEVKINVIDASINEVLFELEGDSSLRFCYDYLDGNYWVYPIKNCQECGDRICGKSYHIDGYSTIQNSLEWYGEVLLDEEWETQKCECQKKQDKTGT